MASEAGSDVAAEGPQLVAQARDQLGALGRAQLAQDDDELVAPDAAADVVFAQPRLQKAAGALDGLVAGGVALLVVDPLEVIDSSTSSENRRQAPGRQADLLAQALLEVAPVPQAGERVPVGQVR